MKQRSTQNSLKGKLNTPLQQLPTTAKVVMAGTMGTSIWQTQKDCDQAEPSSETPNFHAARENKFQSEGVPPKPSTWSSSRDEQTTWKALRGQRSWCCSGPGWRGNQGFPCTRLVTWGSTWKLWWQGNRLTHTHTPEAPFILKAQRELMNFPTLLEKCWLVSDTVLKFDRQP